MDRDLPRNLAFLRLQKVWEEQKQRLTAPIYGPKGFLSSEAEQQDFECFFERYLRLLRSQPPDYGLPPVSTPRQRPEGHLTGAQRVAAALPRVFDVRLRRNVEVVFPPVGRGIDHLDDLLFKGALQHYEDFRQKIALQKLRKLRETIRQLPAAGQRQQLVEAVKEHSVVLVAGDTGCGKSTQVPQFLMEAGFHQILVTQPRRIAAISLARRVSCEQMDAKSRVVGHQIRFDSSLSEKTRILFVTEGILLRRLESDPEVNDFDVVIVDEVHERHLVVDFVLGILREVVMQRRPNLKLVLMSATLQKDLFVQFFDLPDTAVIQIPGRMFPVEIEHIPQKDEPLTIRTDIVKRGSQRKQFDCEPFLEVLRRIESSLTKDERGDVLIFVPGAYEIEALVGAISDFATRSRKWLPLPLHSQMPVEHQDKVFGIAPQGVHKVVVGTNIAETSVTIDGIRFVVDSGRMRGLDVDATSAVRHLSERWVSQASAQQRAGRAGRTGPGRCFRLFSERLFGEMERFTIPEVHRAALEGSLLQVMALGIPLHRFRLPDSPRSDAVAAALQRLLLMRACVPVDWKSLDLPPPEPRGTMDPLVDDDTKTTEFRGGFRASFGRPSSEISLLQKLGLVSTSSPRLLLALTPLGRVLSRLPVDVGVGKMLLLSLVFGVQSSALVLASANGLHSPRVQKHGERQAGRSCHFDHFRGDLFTTLRVYQSWLRERSRSEGGSDSRSRRWCREHGLDERLLFEVNKMNIQLCEILRDGTGRGSDGMRLGAQVRKIRIARLQERMGQACGKLSSEEREALQNELEELKSREAARQKRRLDLEDGEGVLAEDEGGLGYSMKDRDFYGSDEDVANASGGEGNFNRELNRRKRRKVAKPKASSKVRLPENDGLADRMRRRNVEFELRYGNHRHTMKALETLTGQQEELLQMVVALAFYPNLALPHENNRDRCSAECVFHTRHVPFVNLHPSSVLYPQLPTLMGPHDALAYGSILQTHMPFMTHVTRCPVVPTALLCAARVDVSANCRMLICDQWLQLCFEDEDDVQCLVEDAIVLRRSMQRNLDQEVLELFESFNDADLDTEDLSPAVLAGGPGVPVRWRGEVKILKGQDLIIRILGFWQRSWEFKWQVLMPNEYAAFCNDAVEESDLSGDSSWLHYGSISEEAVKPESSLVSDHLAMAFFCPSCKRTLRLNRHGITQHRAECGPGGECGARGDEETPPWRCEKCNFTLPGDCSALEILKHRRSHGL